MIREKAFKYVQNTFDNSLYYKLLGIEVHGMKKGRSRIRMSFRRNLTDFNGIVAGGAIASIAESSIAMALLSLVGTGYTITTLEFKINFFLPVSRGELSTEANIIHKNSQTAVGVAEVFNKNGKLVAKVIATFSIESTD